MIRSINLNIKFPIIENTTDFIHHYSIIINLILLHVKIQMRGKELKVAQGSLRIIYLIARAKA